MSGKLEIILCCNAAPETSSHYHASVRADGEITQLSIWLSKEVGGGVVHRGGGEGCTRSLRLIDKWKIGQIEGGIGGMEMTGEFLVHHHPSVVIE